MKSVPFFNYPDVYKKFENSFQSILNKVGNNGAFIMQGELASFEKKIAEFSNCNYALGVGNATDALEMLLSVSEVGSGDEVIISSHTMIATASAVNTVGAKSIPVECDSSHLIDPSSILDNITSRTKCIMPTQLNGRVSDMDEICKIAYDNDLIIIEDSAQALGAKYNGKNAGTFGVGGCISFYPAKVLGCFGDGGMILCNEKSIYDKLVMMRDHGRDPNDGDVKLWGRNSRLDNLQAAFLMHQFKFYEDVIRRRREIATIYNNNLAGFDQIQLPPPPTETSKNFDIFQNYEVRFDKRDELKAYLYSKGIGSLIQWGGKGIHQFSSLGYKASLPFSEKVFSKMLLLPINMSVSNDDIDYVCEKILSFYRS